MSIKLKHVEKNRIRNVIKYITNPKVSKFLTWKPYNNKKETKKYLEYAISCRSFPDEIFCILYKNTIIGTAHLLYRGKKNMQIGFGILPEFWNKGLGKKIVLKILQHIKNSKWSQQVKNIHANLHNKNIYAERIFVKYNFNLKKINIKKNFNQYVLKINNLDKIIKIT